MNELIYISTQIKHFYVRYVSMNTFGFKFVVLVLKINFQIKNHLILAHGKVGYPFMSQKPVFLKKFAIRPHCIEKAYAGRNCFKIVGNIKNNSILNKKKCYNCKILLNMVY